MSWRRDRTMRERRAASKDYTSTLSAGIAARAAGPIRVRPIHAAAARKPCPLDRAWILSCPTLASIGRTIFRLHPDSSALRPDGLFRDCWAEKRSRNFVKPCGSRNRRGKRSAPGFPPADVRDAGGLCNGPDFNFPLLTATMTVSYPDPSSSKDLRGMGETNAVNDRRSGFTRRRTMMRMAERYVALFGDSNGRVPATFQVLTLTAWAPGAGQAKPSRSRPKKS